MLKEIVTAISGGTPTKSVPRYWDGEIPWISPKDFQDFYLYDAEDHISKDGLEAAGLKLIPANTVLVVVRSGILIHTLPIAITKVQTAINQDVKALLPKIDINSEYLGLYLEIFGSKLLPVITKHSTTVQSVNTDQFQELLIPLPPLETQRALVAEMESARTTRQSKLAEAENLNNIEDYLMHELGLDNLIKDGRSSFAIKLNKLKSKRLDPPSYRPYYQQSNISLQTMPLGKIADIDKNTAEKPQDINTLIPYIGLPECDKTSVREVIFRPYKEVKGRSVIKQGDILFCRIEPGVFTKKYVLANDLLGQEYAYTSTEIYVVKAKKEIVIQEYLYAMFFCPFVYSQIEGKTIGSSGRRRIDPEMFSSLSIPVPDKQKQMQIANEIKRRRAQARQLREEAESGWQSAKEKFEKALLG